MNTIEKLIRFRKISLICLFLSIPLCIVGGLILKNVYTLSIPAMITSITGMLLFIIYITISFIIWKCPYCKVRLPMKFNKDSDIDFVYCCSHCNKKFS
ncbi:MAG: hypothetical protein RSA29_14520 [Clostridium sp.]|uniref:hypothetical protein n=1 Tax=Clostridium sp. TaxID=1506 RepID=UPI0032164838